jgi:hypothetical protein
MADQENVIEKMPDVNVKGPGKVIDIKTKAEVVPTPAKPIPLTALYDITCTVVCGEKQLMTTELNPALPSEPLTLRLLVASETSSQATRKAVAALREWFPNAGVTGLEVVNFARFVGPETAVVVV